ncbi:MAG: DNA-binding response regulator, partial [Pseudonocardia sp.]|nr:DNA-binding response regulator [Pseudonocardia sp.]
MRDRQLEVYELFDRGSRRAPPALLHQLQVFRPAGFAGGATARLTTRAGSYAGDLHVSTTDAALPTRTVL